MKKYISIIAAFFMAGVSGCKKDYLSLETNPNTPSVTTPALSLSAALNASAAIVAGDYTEYGVWAGYWTTSGNYVPNQTINQYQITNTSFQGDWNDWYSNLTNYDNLQQIAAKDPTQAYYQAIAMIMKAYGFSHLVDNYNDVPYTQAFQLSKITFPVYDKGPAIYTDLFKQLDAAIALI
ncbi:MAG: SusD/RagB family nutrient-binding outer membrane lipoprotein, partial [Bacteroidetes bacterium]|nr:SusD/RagB family nutrient-binding outer membrane lipoprotein [Bacteroidota bacterium]